MAGCAKIRVAPGVVLTVEAAGGAIVRVAFSDGSGAGVTEPDDALLARAAAQLSEYFAGARRRFDLPLEPRGAAFQRRVWEAVSGIPYGETRTYGEIARAAGSPGAARAVGAANARNPLAILIPCHRVVAAAGLGGYAGGLALKRRLLAMESAARARPQDQFQQARFVFDFDPDLQPEQP